MGGNPGRSDLPNLPHDARRRISEARANARRDLESDLAAYERDLTPLRSLRARFSPGGGYGALASPQRLFEIFGHYIESYYDAEAEEYAGLADARPELRGAFASWLDELLRRAGEHAISIWTEPPGQHRLTPGGAGDQFVDDFTRRLKARREYWSSRKAPKVSEAPAKRGVGGRKPQDALHARTLEIIKETCGPNWSSIWKEKLEDIAEALDTAQVELPKEWKRTRWTDALDDMPAKLVDVIEYRIKRATEG